MKNHIKKLLFYSFISLLTFSQLNAQSKDEENSLLWKIEGNGIKPSYLFGTFHIIPQKDFELKDKVKTALGASDLLVMELDMSAPGLQGAIMHHAGMKDGMTLDKLMNKSDYEKVDKALIETMGIGLQNFKSFKPFMIGSFLLSNFLGGQPASFEATLTQMAMQKQQKIKGLESVEEQMAVFDKIPYESQIKDVIEMIDEKEKTQKLFDEMIDKYKAEDINGIDKMMEEYFDTKEERDFLLGDRNKNWIPLIGQITKEESAFIGVGAGHLGGKSGLLNLLRAEGYSLTPIK